MPKGQSGFTLLNLTVTAFIGSMFLLFMAQVYRSNNKLSQSIHSNFQLEETLGLSRFLLQKPGVCKTLFAGKEFDSAPTAPKRDREVRDFSLAFPENPSLVIAEQGRALNPKLSILDLYVGDLNPSDIEEFLGALYFRAENEAGYGGKQLIRTLSIIFKTEPIGATRKRIIDCYLPGERNVASPDSPPPVGFFPPDKPEIVEGTLSDTNPGAGINCNSSAENVGKLYLIGIGSPYALGIAPKKVYTAQVDCPEGKRVRSGGAECGSGFSIGNDLASFITDGALGGKAPGFMIASRPTPDQKSWVVACCIEGRPVSVLKAYASCEPDND